MLEEDNSSSKYSKPVTVIVKRIAKRDNIKKFEEWFSGISKEISRQEGSIGIDIIRPNLNISNNNNNSKIEYVIIFRFNNYDNLAKWENLSIRNEWLQKGRKIVEADPDVQKMTSLEFWFTLYFKDEISSPLIPLQPPPRYKMVIVTIPVISILLLTLVPQIHFLKKC